jgi:hypothetical protein
MTTIVATTAAATSPQSSHIPSRIAATPAMPAQHAGMIISERSLGGVDRSISPNVKIVVGHGTPNVGADGYR